MTFRSECHWNVFEQLELRPVDRQLEVEERHRDIDGERPGVAYRCVALPARARRCGHQFAGTVAHRRCRAGHRLRRRVHLFGHWSMH